MGDGSHALHCQMMLPNPRLAPTLTVLLVGGNFELYSSFND